MSCLSEERENFLLNAAKGGLFEGAVPISDLAEIDSLKKEKFVILSDVSKILKDSNPSLVTVSWKDPYEGAWPYRVYEYIYSIKTIYPYKFGKKLAEKLFITAKKLEIENNK